MAIAAPVVEFGLPGFPHHTFDEKIKGTVHLALGRSYPETGGKNVSALHWDLICDLRPGGRILADGETIMEDGIFHWPFEPGR